VYEHAQMMLDAARQAMNAGSSVQDIAQGTLTISVPKAVGRFVIHPLMREFLVRYPQVDVRLRLEDRYMDLIDDGVDLALRITDSPSPGLHGKPLIPINHLICATPEYLRQHGTPEKPEDLRQHSCISLGETPADSRWKFRKRGKSETIQTHGRYAANHRRAPRCGAKPSGDRQPAAVYRKCGTGARRDSSGAARLGVY
jgi:DNA-binding transcriptional LysR family regulator